jgi:hypothetical protein
MPSWRVPFELPILRVPILHSPAFETPALDAKPLSLESAFVRS